MTTKPSSTVSAGDIGTAKSQLSSTSPENDYSDKDIELVQAENQREQNVWLQKSFSEDDAAFMESFDKQKTRKILRKGLSEDLGLTGDQYNIALCIFFIPYCIFEVPSNVILQKFKRPSHWMAIMTISWGVVMTLTGIVKSYTGLVLARFFLGVTEAGFYPGAILIVSSWYMPHEVGTRISLFYTASALAGAFSGLLAFAIAKMDGAGGLEGWRWIFILEGMLTVVMGVAVPFILIDTPEVSTWLDDEERRFLTLRKQFRDGGANITNKGKKFSWPIMRSVLLDYKLYLSAIVYWCSTGPNFGMKFTMPRIIKNMGYQSSEAQLLTVPPYTIGAISAYVACRYSDRFKWRLPFIAGAQIIVVISLAILFAYAGQSWRTAENYFAVCLSGVGFYPINPNVAAWTSNNLAGPAKRAMGIGFMLMIANTAGVIGSFMYKEDESPTYPTGYGTSIGLMSFGLLTALFLELCLWLTNKRDAKFTEEEVRAKYTEQELTDMGDKSPLLKYTL